MATMARAGQLIGDSMATNNAINVQGPTPSFRVRLSGNQSNVTGDSTVYTIPFDTVIYDLTSSFNTTTHVFTVPLDGKYLFNFSARIYGFNATHTQGYFYITVNSDTYIGWEGNVYATSTTNATRNCTLLLDLTAGDTVKGQLQVDNGTKTVDLYGNERSTWFSGAYIPFV